ncbi:CBM21 domain-containing protein [Aphelenchoides fujianensis]|nr:CBM21 domain-containing protein [Aphelenchoides fujianensis]
MGMECVRSSSVKYWPPIGYKAWLQPDSMSASSSVLPHSAPSSSTLFSTSACRRAASFPIANAAFLSGEMHVRSQSESAALNALNVKIPRSIFHEIKLYGNKSSARDIGGVTFYAPIEDGTLSDSDGEDQLSPEESFDDEEDESSHQALIDSHSAIPSAVEQPEMPGLAFHLDCMNIGDFDPFDSLVTEKENKPVKPECRPSSAPTVVVTDTDENEPPSQVEASKQEMRSFNYQPTVEIENAETPKSDEPAPAPETTRTPNKNKSRVRFADECGSHLSCVKVMTEPSDYPPQIPIDVLRRHRKAAGMEDVDEEAAKPKSTWKVMFKQPASEYVKFRHKLETNHVALENAMIKNEFPKMIGTIKVANISFEKRVYLRCTSDGWKTFNDFDAKFQVSASKTYDTFTFEVPLPANIGWKDSNFEFCICYHTGSGEEFWDSNDSRNYKLAGENTQVQHTGPVFKEPPVESKPLPLAKQRAMQDDAYMMDYKNWSKFASWKALSTDMPYW